MMTPIQQGTGTYDRRTDRIVTALEDIAASLKLLIDHQGTSQRLYIERDYWRNRDREPGDPR